MAPRELSSFHTDKTTDAVLRQVLSIARSCGSGGSGGNSSSSMASRIEQATTMLTQQLQQCTNHGMAELGELTDQATTLVEAIVQVQQHQDKEESSIGHNQQQSSSLMFPFNAVTTTTTAVTGHRQPQQAPREQSQQLLHRFLSLQQDQTKWMEQIRSTAVAADQAINGNSNSHHDDSTQALFLTLVQDHAHRTNNHPQTSRFVILLSDIHTLLQQLDNKDTKKKAGLWTPPSDFERKTTKYWVEDSQLPQVMAVAASEVPLLVFGTKGLLSQSVPSSSPTKGGSGDNDDDVLWGVKCASQITSVYLDTADMKFYRERLNRSEGAQLLRVRWYGRQRPVADQSLFLELKTHHEVWIGQKSIKQRVTIPAKFMPAVLSFTNWTRADAERIITATATPNLSAKELDSAIALLWEMHQLVARHQMRPCVRSVYGRVAFQSSHSNSLWLTMDRNVRLYDEMRYEGTTGDQNWCIPDSALASAKHVVVPYAIFEVKLAGSEMPVSIGNLIESGQVLEAVKFSKYLSGAAAFNPVKTLPYWAEHPSFKDFFSSSKSSPLNTVTTTRDNVRSDPKPATMDQTKSPTGDYMIGTPEVVAPRQRRPWFVTPRSSETKIQAIKSKAWVRVEPKSYFANERTFIQWISIAVLLATVDSFIPDDGLTVVANLKHAIMVCAGALILYCVAVYYYRLCLLRGGKPYGYTDVIGPAFLVLAVLFSGSILLLKAGNSVAKEAVLYLKEGQGCQRLAHSFSPLVYEPSDILVHRDKLLVPSFSQVTAVAKSSGSAVTRTLVTIPDTDIESITAVGERIFVVAEGKTESTLIELAWVTTIDDDMLSKVGSWPLKIGKVEGMAYAPDNNGGRLYFGDDEGFIQSSPVPTVAYGDGEIGLELQLQHMNQKLFVRGLTDPKIAALQYLDGILYVLHDNAGVIRGWDLVSGALRSEWKLPAPPGALEETGNQIEGFFLEQQSPPPTVGRSLRGGGSGTQQSYLLHLAVDTPAQLWTLSVNVNTVDRHLTYPACVQ